MNAKLIAKSLLIRMFPSTALTFFCTRSRKFCETHAIQNGLDNLARQVLVATGGKVASGPFAGMALNHDVLPVHNAPKLLGTYEKEIVHFIEDAIAQDPVEIIDVGASNGYYAVGFAIRLPKASIFAIEPDRKSLDAMIFNARLNNVASRIVPMRILRRGDFSRIIKTPNALIIMDCEGAEFELLDPDTDPILTQTNILVEVHACGGNVEDLIQRFGETHSISCVRNRAREASDMPPQLIDIVPVEALEEWRGAQSWLYMKRK